MSVQWAVVHILRAELSEGVHILVVLQQCFPPVSASCKIKTGISKTQLCPIYECIILSSFFHGLFDTTLLVTTFAFFSSSRKKETVSTTWSVFTRWILNDSWCKKKIMTCIFFIVPICNIFSKCIFFLESDVRSFLLWLLFFPFSASEKVANCHDVFFLFLSLSHLFFVCLF